jgi:hypothetical protein
MKKIIILLSAVAFLAACSKKQDVVKPLLTPLNATTVDLAGKWSLVGDTTYSYFNGKYIPNINLVPNGVYFQFSADGSGSENLSPNGGIFTYKVSNGIILLHVAASGSTPAADSNVTITEITATKLVISNGGAGSAVLSFKKD